MKASTTARNANTSTRRERVAREILSPFLVGPHQMRDGHARKPLSFEPPHGRSLGSIQPVNAHHAGGMIARHQQRMQPPINVPRLLSGQRDQSFSQLHIPVRPRFVYGEQVTEWIIRQLTQVAFNGYTYENSA